MLWLAGNTQSNSSNLKCLKFFFCQLDKTYEKPVDTQHEIEKTILAKIVALGQERVRSYLQKALRIVKEYLNESGEFPIDSTSRSRPLFTKLQDILQTKKSLQQLVVECYEISRSTELDELTRG